MTKQKMDYSLHIVVTAWQFWQWLQDSMSAPTKQTFVEKFCYTPYLEDEDVDKTYQLIENTINYVLNNVEEQ